MESFLQILKTDIFLVTLFCINILLLIAFIINTIKFSKLNKKYQNFIKKVGDGKNIEEDLENYMYKVKKVEEQNAKNAGDIKEIENNITKCIQKVGMVRYSAFQDTGSDLSFALALLDNENNGIVLNGIYSREMSNIYAKPIEKGTSSYTLSEEETKALEKAKINGRKNE